MSVYKEVAAGVLARFDLSGGGRSCSGRRERARAVAGSALARSIAATLVAAVGFDPRRRSSMRYPDGVRLRAARPPHIWGRSPAGPGR